MHELEMKIKKLVPEAKLPSKSRNTDSGWDLFALPYGLEFLGEDYGDSGINEFYSDGMLDSGKGVKVHTGIALELPRGYCGFIWDRSSKGLNGLKVMGGVLDNGYRGEIMVILYNLNEEPVLISNEDKIAQLTIQEFPEHVSITEVTELSNTDRNNRGFGSSGR